MSSSYEGLQEGVKDFDTPEIEGWEFKYPGSNTDLSINIPEFTCVCPKTSLPDFAVINIDYRPQKYCIELKSLKEYIFTFRNVGIFHEHVTNKILNDLVKAVDPEYMTVTGIFNARGGIQTTVKVEYTSK